MKNAIESGVAIFIFALIGIPLICWFIYATVKELQKDHAQRAAEVAARPPAVPISSVAPVATVSASQASNSNPASAWNVVVIVVGLMIAAIGLANGLAANAESSALKQTVGALWVIQGLLGMLIAAVGILGVGLIHSITALQKTIAVKVIGQPIT